MFAGDGLVVFANYEEVRDTRRAPGANNASSTASASRVQIREPEIEPAIDPSLRFAMITGIVELVLLPRIPHAVTVTMYSPSSAVRVSQYSTRRREKGRYQCCRAQT